MAERKDNNAVAEALATLGQARLTKEQGLLVFKRLAEKYAEAKTELNYSTDFELLIAVILSAQCTDKRVNVVTDKLFRAYNTPSQFAALSPEELERWIFSCGFYKVKARNIISASRDIVERFSGRVPSTMEELISLAGVGRKTANVILSVVFKEDALAVDTHVFRVARRLGLACGNTPLAVEKEVIALVGRQELGARHHQLIFHGRYCCHSRKPDCDNCPLTDICLYYSAN